MFKTTLLLVAGLLVSTLSQAALPPNFDASKWIKLNDKLIKEGEFSRLPLGNTVSLARATTTDETKERTLSYLTAEVAFRNGMLEIQRVTAVSEDWTKDAAGVWTVDQRLYWLTWTGDLTSVARFEMHFDGERRMLDRKEIFYGRAAEADEMNRWAANLDDWYKLLPQ